MQSDRAGHTDPPRTAAAGSWRNGAGRYGLLSIALHWLMLVLFVAVYATIELRELYPKGSDPREALKTWHYMLGMSVFFLVWLRVVIHATAGPPPLVRPEPGRWQALAARLMHVALYLLMIVMPVAGWLILSAEGEAVPFFGLQLPALVGENKELAGLAEEIHETVGTVGYWLIGLHTAAALFHHYIVRDNTLRRMLPRRT
jgi:cytochrome b561